MITLGSERFKDEREKIRGRKGIANEEKKKFSGSGPGQL